MNHSTGKPGFAGQMTVKQSTEANTTMQYQWSPVTAVSANGSNNSTIAEAQNRSVVVLAR